MDMAWTLCCKGRLNEFEALRALIDTAGRTRCRRKLNKSRTLETFMDTAWTIIVLRQA